MGFFQVFLFTCSMLVGSAEGSLLRKPFRVVIDPGHGGSDTGAVHTLPDGRKVTEKDVTLKLAERAAELLRARGFSVILTREKDQDLPLPDRTKLANKVGADVFVSIHMNSPLGHSTEAEGIETYILNTSTDASSRRLAELENSYANSMTAQDEAQLGANAEVALILKDLRLDGNLSESKRLACAVQTELLSASPGKKNRGIKQALFYVLLGADMPSILLEAGFLSNAKDRDFVLSPKGQATFAQSLMRAVEKFQEAKKDPTRAVALNRCSVKW